MSSNDFSLKRFAEDVSAKQKPLASDKLTNWLKTQMLNQLESAEYGTLTIYDGDAQHKILSDNPEWVEADIRIKDPQFYRYTALGGSVGAAEAYINGYWDSSNLTDVIRYFAVNQSVMDDMEGGLARFTTPLKKTFHWLNKNTQSGSQKNIAAHYDLGNDLFERFLDPTMMYSSGIFKNAESTLEEASIEKLDRICRRLRLTPEDHVIEIGTGWGGFAVYAAKNYGCKVTTTTISKEQYQLAKERVEAAGLTDKVELLLEDYRDLTGTYDKLVSIEMIEAVGHHYFDTFFKKCSDLLKPHGEFVIQAITIADQRFESAKNEIDFIKRYIFPGSCIPSVDSISDSVRKSSDLRILNLFDMGPHYAITLRRWLENFQAKSAELKERGYNDAFQRMWEFYLCYCEGGFMERVISVTQIHMVKPLARAPYHIDDVNDY